MSWQTNKQEHRKCKQQNQKLKPGYLPRNPASKMSKRVTRCKSIRSTFFCYWRDNERQKTFNSSLFYLSWRASQGYFEYPWLRCFISQGESRKAKPRGPFEYLLFNKVGVLESCIEILAPQSEIHLPEVQQFVYPQKWVGNALPMGSSWRFLFYMQVITESWGFKNCVNQPFWIPEFPVCHWWVGGWEGWWLVTKIILQSCSLKTISTIKMCGSQI